MNRTSWDGELFVNMNNQGSTVGYIDADLDGFRIHGASISGSGSNQKAYLADCERIFRQILGRNRRPSGKMWQSLYRGEELLHRVGSCFKSGGMRVAA